MSKKTVIVTTCDQCGKELVGRLTYRTCPKCHADICLACMEKEQAKHKPRERKPKVKQVSSSLDQSSPAEDPEIAKEPNGEPLGFDQPDIISTFSVVTGQDGKPHTLKMGDTNVSSKNLKAGVVILLGLTGLTIKDVEDAPESEGKRLLLNIFNPSKV